MKPETCFLSSELWIVILLQNKEKKPAFLESEQIKVLAGTRWASLRSVLMAPAQCMLVRSPKKHVIPARQVLEAVSVIEKKRLWVLTCADGAARNLLMCVTCILAVVCVAIATTMSSGTKLYTLQCNPSYRRNCCFGFSDHSTASTDRCLISSVYCVVHAELLMACRVTRLRSLLPEKYFEMVFKFNWSFVENWSFISLKSCRIVANNKALFSATPKLRRPDRQSSAQTRSLASPNTTARLVCKMASIYFQRICYIIVCMLRHNTRRIAEKVAKGCVHVKLFKDYVHAETKANLAFLPLITFNLPDWKQERISPCAEVQALSSWHSLPFNNVNFKHIQQRDNCSC